MRGVCRRAATTRAQAAACATSISKAGAIWLGKHRELTRRDVSGVVEWTVCQWLTTDCVFFRRGPAAHTGRRRLEPLGTVEKRSSNEKHAECSDEKGASHRRTHGGSLELLPPPRSQAVFAIMWSLPVAQASTTPGSLSPHSICACKLDEDTVGLETFMYM